MADYTCNICGAGFDFGGCACDSKPDYMLGGDSVLADEHEPDPDPALLPLARIVVAASVALENVGDIDWPEYLRLCSGRQISRSTWEFRDGSRAVLLETGPVEYIG